MCGRFAITLPQDAMAQLFDATPSNDLPQGENFNVCPTNSIAVATSGSGMRRLQPMRWGFLPHWYKSENSGPLLINARAETIAEKPAFQTAARTRRCLIPVTGFYEWTKGEQDTRLPWYIQRTNRQPIVFAGVWQDWEADGKRHRTCAIVTCKAHETMAQIHHRMPVVLEHDDFALWLGEAGHGAAVLMKPCAEDALGFHRVDPAVNSNRAAGPQLIEPFDDE